MDHGTRERKRQTLHGMVTGPMRPQRGRQHKAASRTGRFVPFLLIPVASVLLAAMAGGLVRVGALPWDGLLTSHWLGHAAVFHGALMICGFMGTVIGVERAVAVTLRSAWVAPAASGVGGLLLLAGEGTWGAGLLVVAATAFVGVNAVVVRRQCAAHTVLLLVSAVVWLAGGLLFLLRPGDAACVPWWFAFLVMTIAAERLEMTRLMRRRPAAQVLLVLILCALVAGAVGAVFAPRGGGVLYGGALLLLAVWLGLFDIARRTVRAEGLARYMAVCLLGGYVWLAVAGCAWAGAAVGLPLRDVALHALGLGFVVSMMMGHAPVILPAIARIKLQFGRFFYVPLAALHVSLLVRLGLGGDDPTWRSLGALLNALAIGVFAATMVGAALVWRANQRSVGAR